MSDLSKMLLEIADELNEALGFPDCNLPCEHGGRCSLPTNHDGDHVALGVRDLELCRWPNE